MEDQVYRVVLSHFNMEASVSKKDISVLLEAVSRVDKGEIKNLKELLDVLGQFDIDKKKFEDTVSHIMEFGKEKDIVPIVKNLGEENGIGVLPNNWIKRQIVDERLTKEISESNWNLFRDKNWIEKNKRY